MPNNRIFYACQAVALAPMGATSVPFKELHGVQSVGVNTTFNLEQAFELGQISIYENIEGLPDIELTIERVLDGYPLAYRLATKKSDGTSPGNTLVERTKQRCDAVLAVYPDDQNAVAGTPPVQVYMSGMYINSVSYTLPVDGNCTESITLVGNHKVWDQTGKFTSTNAATFGSDTPKNNQVGSIAGGIQRRENVLMSSCILPQSIYGVAQNTNAGNNYANNAPLAHIQNISISTDTGRENILELGRKAPYYRAPNFPIEVTCEIEVIAISGDFVSAYEEGRPSYVGGKDQGNNTAEEVIKIVLQDGTTFDLGTKNRLSSVTYGGADAGGGNASITYSYSTFNDLTVTGPFNNASE